MIEFILLNEQKEEKSKIQEIIDKVLMNYEIDYKIIKEESIEKILNRDSFKIYILEEIKGLEIAKRIRLELDDWNSYILFIGNNFEKIQKERLFILDYIEKSENFYYLLERDIKVAMKSYDKRPNQLKFTYKKTTYSIDYYKILYIEKEQDNKRCIIKTKDDTFYIPISLKKIEEKLDNRFIKCSKSHIVNIEQVEYYDTKENIIGLKNKEIVTAISEKEKKNILEKLRAN